jgi:hypothetical protein
MPHDSTRATRVETEAEWFSMIIGYLQLKSFAFWLEINPESTFEQFETVWPALLDQMLARATAATVDELQKLIQITFN